MDRPDWDRYFINITKEVSRRSTCLRRNIGAIIVRDYRILSTGYNGAPSGFKHCDEVGCIRDKYNIPSGEKHELCRAVHAEQNAIIQAAIHGASIMNADMYVISTPCIQCAKMIINAKIKRVNCIGEKYGEEEGISLLEDAGIEVVMHDD